MRLIFFLGIVLSVFLYYFLDDSYRYSLEAKAYFEMGKYDKAYNLAKKAYDLNKYNKMAFTIITQAKIAQSWKKYIQESAEYFYEIDKISNKSYISKADKMRIKMMLEIIIDGYKTLKQSKLISQSLKDEAYNKYKKAKEFYDGIFKRDK
jgi:tetratricopeptide (TPR) repeat protein